MATKQTLISEFFRNCEKAQDNVLVVIDIDLDSINDEVECKERLSGKSLNSLSYHASQLPALTDTGYLLG